MAARRRFDHRDLTRDIWYLDSRRFRRRRLLLAVTLPIALGVAAAAVPYAEKPVREALGVRQQPSVDDLQAALNETRLELEVELATRSELERRVAGLNEELERTREELAFVKSAGKPAAKP